MPPSVKNVPECRLVEDYSSDFFFEHVIQVDTKGWETVLSLMHQFAEMFNFFDYVSLGAKIAKYVEMVSIVVDYIMEVCLCGSY